jgi:hypothetical protein
MARTLEYMERGEDMKTHQNRLLFETAEPHANLDRITSPTIMRRDTTDSPWSKRSLRDLRRKETAAEALAGFDTETQIFGYTKGQFSVIDVIREALKYTGPATLDVSTWTAANTDVTTVCNFVGEGNVTAARWLVDLTFQRRSPQLAKRIRDTFGKDAIRVAQNHAKFALIQNEKWKIVLNTSMNLNFNPRFENFSIAHDPEAFAFHKAIMDEIWKTQRTEEASETPYEIQKHFARDL